MPKTANSQYPAGIWKNRLPHVRNAVLPSFTPLPNPVATPERVIASIFAPGAICGVSRQDGRLLWRVELDSYGGRACVFLERRLYGTSCRSLYALNPKGGDILWKFTPYAGPGEWIYSQPAPGNGRIFIGDRKGFLHCLDAVTGEHLWRRRTSQACNNQANATALVVDSHVVTANNDGVVVCYSADSGSTIWRRRTDGPVIAAVLKCESDLIIGSTSLYRLDMVTGSVLQKMSFPGKGVSSVAIAQRRIIAHLGPNFRDRDAAWKPELVVIEGNRVIARRPTRAVAHLGSYKGFAIAANHSSLKILDLIGGKVLASRRCAMAVPDLAAGRLYGLTDNGVLFADSIPSF